MFAILLYGTYFLFRQRKHNDEGMARRVAVEEEMSFQINNQR